MEPLAIAKTIQERFPDEVREVKDYGGQASVVMRRDRIVDVVAWLKDDTDLSMDFLRDLCGVDYLGKKETRFEVVYHLYSIQHRHLIRLRVGVPEDDPRIDSIVPIHRGANWHERECFDLYGITFTGHPDLRRILLPEDWDGHPLRKDYPLKGPEGEWKRFAQMVERAEELKKYEWYAPKEQPRAEQ